jgi:transcriptional regulator of arginine metabolism
VAVALDSCRFPEVAGTLAGDDTVLVVVRSERDRPKIRRRLEELLS